MESVTCNIDLCLTDEEDIFGDGWDFTIRIYQFHKISDTRVRVTFVFEDEVTRRDDDGVLVSGHSTWTHKYIEVEENLQTLLDLICFQTSGVGLKLLPDTLEMTSRTITSHRSEQTHSVNLKEHEDIKARFEKTTGARQEELLDALRLYRLAANEENDGEKIGQLWGAMERLYAANPPKVLDTKQKRLEMQKLIDQATLITSEDKTRLKNTISNTYKVSKPSVIAEKFGLIGGGGEEMKVEQVKEKLDYWLSTRSIQSHGEILMRNQDVNMLAAEMGHIMETALGGAVKPSKYVYFVYKPTDVEDTFLSSQQAVTKKDSESGYSYTPLHKFAAFHDMSDRLRHSLKEQNSEIYLVDYRAVTRVQLNDDTSISPKDLEDTKLAKLINELQTKLN